MHYHFGFRANLKVKQGLMECITRMVEDKDEQTLIDIQIDDFKKREKFFGCPLGTRLINLKTLANWWESYGDEYPKRQKIVIHVLSLTCSSFGCEHNWNSFEMVS